MDATYRNDLRELNELNFARFDAKVEQRVAEIHARIDRLGAEVNGRIDKLDIRFDQRTAEVVALLERRLGEQTRWMFLAWASLLIPIIGLWIRR